MFEIIVVIGLVWMCCHATMSYRAYKIEVLRRRKAEKKQMLQELGKFNPSWRCTPAEIEDEMKRIEQRWPHA